MCMANVPEYVDYLKDCSFESVFKWHKKFFQMLELNGRPKRWLLKDPSHIGHIPEILSTYPNAKFINIHRSPMESIGSFCSLAKNIRSAFSKNVNTKEIGNVILDFWQHSLNKGIDAKQNLSEGQIIDVSYSGLISNPLLSIKDIYEKFGLDIDIETENSMKQYLINQTKIKKQKHNYSLEEFGLNEKNINEVEELTEKTMTQVTIKTSVGDIQLELNDEKAPITVENFKAIAQSGYYEGTIFHRVINGFMVQGGGLTADMNNKSSGTAPIQNEANNGLSNDRGTVAMARTMDPHSATSQFFINHKDNGF